MELYPCKESYRTKIVVILSEEKRKIETKGVM